MIEKAEAVLSFWFGALEPDGRCAPSVRERWFKRSDAFDQEVRDLFQETHALGAEGGLAGWLTTPRGRLAYVILLDQLSRNMFRETPRMYATDEQALSAAAAAVDAGEDRGLRFAERGFLYMPFMHSERLADQDRCVELFTAFQGELSGALREEVAVNAEYARKHQVIVARFGRFPHRNAILGRASTEEELAFLKEPGSSF